MCITSAPLLSVFRVNKLKETMTAVQQLEKNMSNLRSWLSRIEAELTKPVHYSICNGDEIQKRLEEQQASSYWPPITRHDSRRFKLA